MTLAKHITDPRAIKLFNTLEDRLTAIHNGKYDYSKTVYSGNKNALLIICPVHGEFTQNCGQHLNKKQGCKQCSELRRRDTRSNNVAKTWVQRASIVHNGKYRYSKFVYTKSHLKAIITCPIHGDFEQQISAHIKGQGCAKCVTKGYHDAEYYKGKPCVLYYIAMPFNTFKIGITKNSVRERYAKELTVNYTVIDEWVFPDGAIAYQLEQACLKATEQFQYEGEPILKAGGNTELRSKDVSSIIYPIIAQGITNA